jgi:hypothetical protein
MIRKLINRIQMMICKALLASVDDTQEIQLVKVIANEGEVQDGLERIQDYGFTSNPPLNGDAVILYIGGNKDHGVVIKAGAGAVRKKGLLTGEVSVYTRYGNYLHMKASGLNEMFSSTGNDIIGFTNLGALGGVPLLKVTPAYAGAWADYFTKAALSWTALGTIPELAGIKSTLDASAASATAMAASLSGAQTTQSAGV